MTHSISNLEYMGFVIIQIKRAIAPSFLLLIWKSVKIIHAFQDDSCYSLTLFSPSTYSIWLDHKRGYRRKALEDWGISFFKASLENNAFVATIRVQTIKVDLWFDLLWAKFNEKFGVYSAC